ncbi:MAG: amidase [Chloroflexi bacterium]|nr:amidase [Chloroflexota bacterium]
MRQYQIMESLRSGQLTLPEYLSQVEAQFIEREPSVIAFIPEEDRFARLHDDAESLVARYPDSINRPPLFGMMAGIKDIFHAEGFATQAGSRLPSKVLQGAEAESVSRLRDAGALILGKTVTTEFAYFSPGPTRNPHNPEHTPGGSSSGSAAAVAAGYCNLALGTQTIGSIIRPASFCGVVGLKPTYDRISREGVIPLSPSLDHVGFFAPDVFTAQQAASVLFRDWSAKNRDWRLEIEDRKPIIGIPEGVYLNSASSETLNWFRSICQSLTDAGYKLSRVSIMDDFQAIRSRHDVIMSAEAAQVHKDWFEKYRELYSAKFTELIKRGQEISNLQSSLGARDDFRAELRRAMIDHNIDLWICPSTVGPAPKGLDSTGDPVMNLPWTQAGLPAINLPAGKNQDDLPMGLQVVGNWYKDESLLFWAKDLEKVLADL